MNRIESILPNMSKYLEMLEPISKQTFPCACQESSLILYAWLIKNRIECSLVVGYYADPVVQRNTFHCWVETDDCIVDGVTVQFLLSDYDRARSYEEIRKYSNKTKFCYERGNGNYQKEKVYAYVDKRLLNTLINDTGDTFIEFMYDVQKIFILNASFIKECLGKMMYSGLYKIDATYYGFGIKEFLEKFDIRERCLVLQFIVQY